MPCEEQSFETTLYSLSPDAPDSDPDRRADERHLSLYRVGTLHSEETGQELCLIKNVSSGGMKIRAYCPVREGLAVRIELKNGQPIAGIVHWVRDRDAGIRFEHPIDIIELLSPSMSGPTPRMPRIEIACTLDIRHESNIYLVRARDISQGGMKIESDETLPVGSRVVVRLPGWGSEPGVVRWNDGPVSGILFNRVLPLNQLVEWLRNYRAPERAAG